mmetsp:Transcript_31382/g.86392  ORF Transcript_31382/g.86392 Transcript_31382/m.86392 type:complete len:186 (-) Transcript_31382:126-683(-)
MRHGNEAEGAVPEPEPFYDGVRQRTPSPEVHYARGAEFCTSTAATWSSLLQASPPVSTPASGDVAVRDGIPPVGGMRVLLPIFYPPTLTSGKATVQDSSSLSTAFALTTSPTRSILTPDVSAMPAAWTVSRGSVGHPFSCGKPCKFAKKRRGCKEGSACELCHLCEWRRCEWGQPPTRLGQTMPR